MVSREYNWIMTEPGAFDCSRCQRTIAVYQCLGCGRFFCSQDARKHRDELNHELAALINHQHQVRRNPPPSMNDYFEKLRNNCDRCTREIEDWESNSIKLIKELARNAHNDLRELFDKYSRRPAKMDEKVIEIERRMDQAQRYDDFHDEHLKRWKNALQYLNQDMTDLRRDFVKVSCGELLIHKIGIEESDPFEGSFKPDDDSFTPHIQFVIPPEYNPLTDSPYELRYGVHRFRFRSRNIFFGIRSNQIDRDEHYGSRSISNVWNADTSFHLTGSTDDQDRRRTDLGDSFIMEVNCDHKTVTLINERYPEEKQQLRINENQCPLPWLLSLGVSNNTGV